MTYGGDSGNRIFVLYWRCPLIRVSIIKGATVLKFCKYCYKALHLLKYAANTYLEIAKSVRV
jgi:hypothetical protein